MADAADIAALDLAALLASRVCHDIISPVGAITNGLEVLEEETGEEMRSFAMDLIKKSARQASAKLQFARLAFGAAGSAGAEIDLGDAEAVTRNFMSGEKANIEWTAVRVLMPKNKVKLLLNLVLIATHAIPRGGTIRVTVEGAPTAPTFRLACTGTNARIPPNVDQILDGRLPEQAPDAHMIQPIYAGLLARAAAMRATVAKEGDDVVFTAVPQDIVG
ncbi:histidine phosphotransferase ChpT [Prosthecomicrobium hirschii]|uniref:Histidine phosphotransferase n=1 Tax=Prosthecodimorpha hirschii TaxID=665126 RepID=A0A0P6VTW2_9HYPH|nr:histidine phosphotransferase family protein [Prosthecomicrobium hirschii]KPL54390.1 histidine phosphotransferase [Prosthecomicrobium hirschii]MCW1840776.1 histidine phosphotransferase family protein [Prosthecomicrobium hirschii]TPQ48508.1 histidine phosphotransferase [Prosthecomicrobium hirschii]